MDSSEPKENIFARKLREMKEGKTEPPQPKEPPPLEPGYTRIKYEDLLHCTEKATLFVIDGEKKWMPNSVIKNHLNFDVLDIKNSFYESIFE